MRYKDHKEANLRPSGVINRRVANLVNYGTQDVHPEGWRISLGLAVVPAAILCVGGNFLPETANSLAERDHVEELAEGVRQWGGHQGSAQAWLCEFVHVDK